MFLAILVLGDTSFVYFGMQSQHAPSYRERGLDRGIRDDTISNQCKINGKRIDAE